MKRGVSLNIESLFYQEYAGLGIRAWAALLDYLFLSLLFKVIRILFSPAQLSPWLMAAIVLFYLVLTTGISGQTLGKWAMGIRVTDLDGNAPGIARIIIRTVGYLVSLPLFMGFLWINFDQHRRGWHDLIAGTKVVLV